MDSSSVLFRPKAPHIPNLLPSSTFSVVPTRSFSQIPVAALREKLRQALVALDAGNTVDSDTYIRLLQYCIESGSLSVGRRLHAKIGSVRDENPFVETKIVSMYAKCGSLAEARKVFDEMPERNLFTWSTMISSCAWESWWEHVVELFRLMMREGVTPDEYLLPKILQACANLEDVDTGKVLHSIAVKCGYLECSSGAHVRNSVLGMYAKCGELRSARWFFERMNRKDQVSWNSMILGYCLHGENYEALNLFDEMQTRGIHPNLITWNILIKGCNQTGDTDRAMEMTKTMQLSGLVPDSYTWSSLICGLVHNKRMLQALELMREMHLAGVEMNSMTFAGALSACASLKALEMGRQIHSLSTRVGHSEIALVGNALIDFYAKCGMVEEAERIFGRMPEKDACTWNSMIGCYMQSGYCSKAHDLFFQMENMGVKRNTVTWNVIISGYMQNGDQDQAMELFQRMETDGVRHNTASWNLLIAGLQQKGNRNGALQVFRRMQSNYREPNWITILSVLPACANLVSAKMVKEIHACVLRRGLQFDLLISNALVDTYAKCGDIMIAQSLFDHLSPRDSVTWNSLISGYLLHGYPETALSLFHRMEQGEGKPDHTTLARLISTYGMLGMVNEAKNTLSSMAVNYGISPGQEHFTAMIDVYGRSGRLSEALDFIKSMPNGPDSAVWSSLLDASRIHGNKHVARLAAEQLIDLEPWNSVVQHLLIQIQALGRQGRASRLLMKFQKEWRDVEKHIYSWLCHSGRIFSFSAGDMSFTDSHLVYDKLHEVEERMERKRGDLLQNRYLEVEDEGSEKATGIHSEKLAIGFALINSPACGIIKVVKNFRTCLKCHEIAKYISLEYNCEIMLKDSKCLHHFKFGKCSCGDYW